MPRALDLFAGTHSFTKVAQELGWEVISLDIDPKSGATITADILEFDYKIWPQGHFDFIWASPPCTTFSIACAHLFSAEERDRRAAGGCEVARRTKEIVEYLKPKFYAIENPLASKLWTMGIFEEYPKNKLSYCMYGFPYRKNTILASNAPFEPKLCRGDCGFVREVVDQNGKKKKHHQEVAKQGVSQHCRGLGVQNTTHTRAQLYRVPEKLIKDVLESVGSVAAARSARGR
jgi:hypothetical protein